MNEILGFVNEKAKVLMILRENQLEIDGNNICPLNQQEIADLVGVHRVTVTNTLQALKKEKIIHIANRGEITVVDREKLRSKIQGKIEI